MVDERWHQLRKALIFIYLPLLFGEKSRTVDRRIVEKKLPAVDATPVVVVWKQTYRRSMYATLVILFFFHSSNN
jgi:ACR3 family arsenite efflux pump ArsB